MGLVLLDMAISLDGFAAAEDRSSDALFPGFDELRRGDVMQELIRTRRAPEQPARGLSFTFVTDGVESAVRQAKEAAGDRNVTVIGGASTARQCLQAGLLDEIQVHLVPALLGGGLRLFDGHGRVDLERVGVSDSAGMAHLRFRVAR